MEIIIIKNKKLFLKNKNKDIFLAFSKRSNKVMWLKFKRLLFINLKLIPYLFLGFFLVVGWKMYELKKENKTLQKRYLNIQNSISLYQPYLPPSLRLIPPAETSNLVLKAQEIKIRNVIAPYNASLIKKADNYLLFFRYDIINQHSINRNFFSYIGCIELDKNFKQTAKEFCKIDTQSNFSEDPRTVQIENNLYLIYNDLHSSSDQCRSMHLANIDVETLKTNFITELDFQMQPIEKNWSPFEYIDKQRKSHLYFEYYLTPHIILKLKNPKTNSLKHLIFPNFKYQKNLSWPKLWGTPRSGTVSLKINEQEYLSFFHSVFTDKNKFVWYVIGAYTFDKDPPFRITRISQYPIFFNGIYESTPINTADPCKRVLFPCSFVFDKYLNKEVIHLSCGENDSHIKIITLDKNILLKNLKKI